MTDKETVQAGGNSEPHPLNTAVLKSVHIVEGGSFDGSLDVEISNDADNWAKHKTGINGVVEIDKTVRYARVVDTSGTSGEYTVIWNTME